MRVTGLDDVRQEALPWQPALARAVGDHLAGERRLASSAITDRRAPSWSGTPRSNETVSVQQHHPLNLEGIGAIAAAAVACTAV